MDIFTRKFLTLLSALLCSQSSWAGDISPLGESRGYELILFSGPIIPGDAQRIATAFQKTSSKSTPLLMIDSPGGNVREAMKIGDYLEQNEIGVVIPPIMSCLSSCVLALAGGDSKSPRGRIGIHRPFVTDLDLPENAAATALTRIQTDIRLYLEKKGVAPALIDDMFSVEPHRMQILTNREISSYRLDQTNYLKQEERDIRIAKSLGLTRQQYVAKQAEINEKCTKSFDYGERATCINAIFGGNLK